MTTVLVEYVGRKVRCTDRIAGTGLVWEGNGDVHPVPVAAWEKLSLHPDMWALVDEPASTLGLINTKQPEPYIAGASLAVAEIMTLALDAQPLQAEAVDTPAPSRKRKAK